MHAQERPTTNDATCGPPAWLTGTLHEGGIRSVRSPPRRAPLLATPIATPLQGGRPERPGLFCFNYNFTSWIGIDKGALTSHCDYVEKIGWVATPDSCHGAAQLANITKDLSAELLTSHLPCDYYLGEITVPDNEKTKYQVILDGKQPSVFFSHATIEFIEQNH